MSRARPRQLLDSVSACSWISRAFRIRSLACPDSSNTSSARYLRDVTSPRRRNGGGVHVTHNSATGQSSARTLNWKLAVSPGRSNATSISAWLAYLGARCSQRVTRCAFPSPKFDNDPATSRRVGSPDRPLLCESASPVRLQSATVRFHHERQTVAPYVSTETPAAIHEEVVPRSIGEPYGIRQVGGVR